MVENTPLLMPSSHSRLIRRRQIEGELSNCALEDYLKLKYVLTESSERSRMIVPLRGDLRGATAQVEFRNQCNIVPPLLVPFSRF